MPHKEGLIISFNYGLENLDPLYDIEDELMAIIDAQNLGKFDGHAIAADLKDGVLYMYSEDAEQLYAAVKPILDKTAFLRGGKAKLTFCNNRKNVEEIEIEL